MGGGKTGVSFAHILFENFSRPPSKEVSKKLINKFEAQKEHQTKYINWGPLATMWYLKSWDYMNSPREGGQFKKRKRSNSEPSDILPVRDWEY